MHEKTQEGSSKKCVLAEFQSCVMLVDGFVCSLACIRAYATYVHMSDFFLLKNQRLIFLAYLF